MDIRETYSKFSVKDIEASIQDFKIKIFKRGTKIYPDIHVPATIMPVTISKSKREDLVKSGQQVISALKKVVAEYFGNKEIQELVHLNKEEKILIHIDPGYRDYGQVRLDCFFAKHPQFVELNSDNIEGFCMLDIIAEEQLKSPLNRKLATKIKVSGKESARHLKLLLAAYKNYFTGQKKKPLIAVIGSDEKLSQTHYVVMKKYFISQGYESIIANPWDLRLDNHGQLVYKNKIISLIRRHSEIRYFTKNMHRIKPLIKAYENGKVCIVNSFRTRLLGHKSLFAILSDPRFSHLFNKQEQKAIKKTIPWTRILLDTKTVDYRGKKIDLLKYAIINQRDLVIKPSGLAEGEDIFVGCDTDTKKWREVVKNNSQKISQKGNWIVQRKVNIPKQQYPIVEDGKLEWEYKNYDLNVHFSLYNNKIIPGSLMSRFSDNNVLNVMQGGGFNPVFIKN